eukprot:UN08430
MVKTTFPRVPRFPLVSALPLPWNLDRGLSLDQGCQVLFSPSSAGLALSLNLRPPFAWARFSLEAFAPHQRNFPRRGLRSGSSSEGSGLLLGFSLLSLWFARLPWLSLSWSLIVIVGIFRRPSFSSFTGFVVVVIWHIRASRFSF